MNILFINGWSDDNKGDLAIIQGLLTGFRRKWKQFSFQLSPSCDFLPSHHRFISVEPDFNGIVEPILPVHIPQVGFIRKIVRIADLFVTFFILLAPSISLILGGKYKRNFNAYSGAELIVSKGGHIFITTGTMLGGLVGLYYNMFPIILGVRMKKKVAIVAQSIGGFSHPLHAHFCCYFFRRAAHISAREDLTRNLLLDNGVSKAKFIWDTAFLVAPSNNCRKFSFSGQPYCVITIRPWTFPGVINPGELYNTYVNEIVSVVEMLESRGVSAVFVPQVRGPYDFENDINETKKMETVFAGRSSIHFLYDDLSPSELVGLYKEAYFVFGTRFHSVILALSAGVPSIAISYSGFKAIGIMQKLGLGDFVLDINKLKQGDAVAKCIALMSNIAYIKSLLDDKVPELKKAMIDELDAI